MSEDFYIVSVCHTPRRDPYITFWRPDNRGYAYPLSWAGKYPREIVAGHLGYYNDGHNNIAVRCDAIDPLAVAPEKGVIDNDAGPVVPNSLANWKTLLAAVIEKPAARPKPTPNPRAARTSTPEQS
jgi:hypothetical protein